MWALALGDEEERQLRGQRTALHPRARRLGTNLTVGTVGARPLAPLEACGRGPGVGQAEALGPPMGRPPFLLAAGGQVTRHAPGLGLQCPGLSPQRHTPPPYQARPWARAAVPRSQPPESHAPSLRALCHSMLVIGGEPALPRVRASPLSWRFLRAQCLLGHKPPTTAHPLAPNATPARVQNAVTPPSIQILTLLQP